MSINLKEKIQECLKKTRLMQLATSVNDRPWVCSVYYAFDDELSLYWISLPRRRHSQEIIKNSNVSATIAYSQEPYPEKGIQGLTFKGAASELSGDDEKNASILYVSQLNREESLLEDVRSGKNPHKFYKLTPSYIKLFDTINFPNDPEQILEMYK